MKNYYCLITSDSKGSAFEIFKKRINEKKWPIYFRTSNGKKINSGDELVFYIAGENYNSQHLVANATVETIDIINETIIDPDREINYKNEVFRYLILKNVEIFNKPINIKSILNDLQFIKNKKNYGANLVGGARKISYADFIKIKEF
jgi:predicted RNA-binding protein